ncbi:MAG: sugar phosphate nucleotidyltransferase [bacterium]|nr:sugar phosphate nucleotidyltransferase [bacterium]
MKAIIPVAGAGTRLKPHTHTVPKALIYVAGKPILGHILDELESLGVTEIIFIIGYLGEMITEYVDATYRFKSYYVRQEELKGLGHAIHLARYYVKDEPILIILGDTIFKADLHSVLNGEYSAIGVKNVRDPHRFGIVEMKNGFISRLVEKPDEPKTDLAIVGIYYIKNSNLLFKCLDELITNDIRTKGEYQLTDALQMMIERDEKIKTFLIDGWYDCGKPETLLETNRYILEQIHHEVSVEGSIIIPPVFIADTVTIENSIIGPYVSIADNSFISNSVIKNSIINKNAVVKNILLAESVVGDKASVNGKFNKLNVGDSSEVDFS